MLNFAVTGLIYIGIQCILSLGMNVQWGLTGLLNLAYIVFMAAGAYATSVLTLPKDQPPFTTYILGLNLPFYVGMLGAVLAGGMVAAAIGVIALGRRLRADYLAVVSLVVAVVLAQVIAQDRTLFDGYQGLINVPVPFGAALSPLAYNLEFLGMTIICAAGIYVLCDMLRKSPFGRTLRAVREDDVAAEVFGHNVYVLKLKAFVFGGAVAGLAGSLTVLYVSSFNTAGWSVSETLFILTCLMVGGSGNNLGVIIGTAIVVGLFNQATQLLPIFNSYPVLITEGRIVVIALLLLAALRWRPQGLLPERPSRTEEVSYAGNG